MAGSSENIDDLVGKQSFDQFDKLLAYIDKTEAGIVKLNKMSINLETKMSNATTLKDAVTTSQALVDVQGRLVSSTSELNKAVAEAARIKAQYNGSTKEVLQTSQQLSKVKAEEAKAQQQVNKEELEGEKIRTQAAKTRAESAKATLEEARATTENAKQKELERKYTAALIKEKERLESLQQREETRLAKLQSAYGQLNSEYKIESNNAKELGAQYFLLQRQIEQLEAARASGASIAPGNNSAKEIASKKLELDALGNSMQAANQKALGLQKGLLSIEQAVGQSQRNVGNYANSVFALTQVLREAPAFTYSFQTGLLAISNNLPILIDEFNKVKTATGSASSAFKIFAGSIFTASNIMTLAFAAITIGVGLLGDMGKKTKEATEATTDLTKAQDELNKNIGREVAELNTLRATAENTLLSYRERGKAVDELQSKFPDVFANLKRELILNGQVGESYDRLTEKIIANAKTRGLGDSLADAFKRIADAQALIDQYTNNKDKNTFFYASEEDVKRQKQIVAYNQQRVKELSDQIQGQKEINNLSANEVFYLDAASRKKALADEAEAKRRALLTKEQRADEDRDSKKKPKKDRDLTKEKTAEDSAYTQAIYAELQKRALIEAEIAKGVFENDKNSLDERLRAYDLYTQKRIEAAGYILAGEVASVQVSLDKIKEIEQKASDKRTDEENDLLRKKKLFLQQQENYTAQYELDITKLSNDNVKTRANETEKELKRLQKLAEDVSPKIAEAFGYPQGRPTKVKKDKDGILNFSDKDKKDLENVSSYTDAAIASFQGLFDVLDQLSKRRLDAIQLEKDALSELTQQQIDAVNRSVGSQDEKETKIAEIKARAAAKQEALDAKVRAEQRKAAEREKALTIAKIVVETALAVVHQLGSGDGYTAIARGIAVGVIGAAQLAAAIAQPIPSFAKGTDSSPAGLAITDELGPELYVEPDGNTFLGSNDGPTLRYLKKGTQIYTHDQLMQLAYAASSPSALMAPHYSQYDGENVVHKLDVIGQKIVNAIDAKEAVSLQNLTSFYSPFHHSKIRTS